MKIDGLIHPRWILTVNADDLVLDNHSLAVDAGRILEILPTARARRKYEADAEHILPDHALLPGLINAHTHAAMTLLRGLADDMPLMKWLNEHIWPAESRWVGAEFVHDGTLLAIAEMIRGGTTCFNDMYFFPDVTARAAEAAGIRVTIGLIAIDFPSAWAKDADDYLRRGLLVHDQYRNHRLVKTAFAPHAPYSVSDGALERIRILADELDIPVHMHVHETRDEIRQGLQHSGKRPLQRLQDLGLLSPSLIAVHMTQLLDDEIDEFAASGAHVVHCPESNLKLASGFCPSARLIGAGINLALGTDGAASNNDLDMFGEMRTAALLAKGIAGDARVLPSPTALRMATINGARALGMDALTGSLEAGKAADIISVDLGGPETSPLYDPVSQLVYATGREAVRNVWIAGRQVLKDRQLTTVALDDVLTGAAKWRTRIEGTDS